MMMLSGIFSTEASLLFIGIFYVGLPFLIILSARKNWRTFHEAESVVEFVGYWRRLAIVIIDIVLTVLIVPIFFNICYYIRDGQTIGDKIFGTKIVDKKSMKTASVGQLLMRTIAKILSFLPLCFGFITAGWRSEKRAWHDGLTDTRYISYKKIHGIWTWLIILLVTVPFVLFIVIPLVSIVISGYGAAAIQPAVMGM